MYQLLRDSPKLILAIILANILLSAWSVMLDSVVNNDGITYLSMAELYLQGNWQTANSYYSWPFYPLLVAALAKVLWSDVTLAAHVLNTVFATSMSLAFVAVVGQLSQNNRRILIIAALVILFFPSITKYRAYIIRDFAYLSFYLWSLYFLFRFVSTSDKKNLIGWLVTTALGCLFRFEGIILMLVAPVFLFAFSTNRTPHRLKVLATLSISILVVSIAVISWYLQDKYQAALELAQLAGVEVDSVFELLLRNVVEQTDQGAVGFIGYLSPMVSNVGDLTYDIIRRMAVVYFFLCLYAYWKGFGLHKPLIKRIWLVYLFTNLVMLIGFSLTNNLIVSRYTLATCLTLLLLAPFAFDYLLKQLSGFSKPKRIAVYTLIGLTVLVSLKDLDVRSKKTHMITAGTWLKQNLPEGTRLFSNDRIIMHYAKQGPESNFADLFTNARMRTHLDTGLAKQYDFIALSVSTKDPQEVEFQQTLVKQFGEPIHIVNGKKGRVVPIFTTKAQYQHLSTVK